MNVRYRVELRQSERDELKALMARPPGGHAHERRLPGSCGSWRWRVRSGLPWRVLDDRGSLNVTSLLEAVDSDPWQLYITTSTKPRWAMERRQGLADEQARLTLLGSGVPNYDLRRSVADESVTEASDNMNSASDGLTVWLGEHGVGEHPSRLFTSHL